MILTILHGIGIVLLWILLIVLLLLAYFLICPIWINGQGGVEPEPFLKLRIFGCIHFWQIRYDTDGDAGFRIYAFWGKLQIYPKPQKANADHVPEQSDTTAEEVSPGVKAEADSSATVEQKADDDSLSSSTNEAESSEAHNHAKASERENRQTVFDNIKNTPHHKKTVKSEAQKQAQKEKLQHIYQMITDIQNRNAVSFMLKQAGGLLKSMHINLGGTDLSYALSEPDYTGYLSGILALFPFIYGPDIRLIPDFNSDEAYARGHLSVKAHLNPGILVWKIIRIAANSDCRRLIKQLKALQG